MSLKLKAMEDKQRRKKIVFEKPVDIVMAYTVLAWIFINSLPGNKGLRASTISEAHRLPISVEFD